LVAATLIVDIGFIHPAHCEPTEQVSDPALLARLKHPRAANAVIFCDAGSVITGCADGALRVWDVKTGKVTKRLQVSDEDMMFDELFYLSRSQDGKTVFFSSGRTIQAWDMSLEKPIWQLKFGALSNFSHMTMSHAGGQLALCNIDSDIWLLDARTGKMQAIMKCPDAATSANSVSFTRDDKAVVVAYNSQILVWDTSSAKVVDGLWAGKSVVDFAFPSPDGKLLAIDFKDDKAVHLWNVEKRASIGQLRGHKGFPGELFFVDKDNLFSADTAGAVIHWDLAQKK
jgi:WD40 repeat protein